MLLHELVLLATVTLGADGGVDAVKDVFTEVEAASLNSESLRDCSGEDPSDVEVLREASGTIRKLVRSNGSEDHTESATSYFDTSGRLRFLFVKAGAVPSAHVESRWWFDERGKVIKHKREAGGEGPHYFGAELKPYLVKDAAAFLKNMQRCP
jgi:hypothetical protein